METPTPQKSSLHPALWIAAIAVTLFSLVGIAALTGLLPGSKGAPETQSTVAAVDLPPPPPMPAVEPAPAPAPQAPAAAPVPEKKVAKPATKPKTNTASGKPRSVDESVRTAQPAPPPPCPNCAVVSAVTPITQEGEGTGLGAIAGGVLGGVLGHQIGGGTGRTVATVAGAAGGAYAGHQVEKSQRSHTAFDITVRFEDGSTQVIRENAAPVWHVGDKVLVQNGQLVPR